MLSRAEKREMLEDARSIVRRDNFRVGKIENNSSISFDDYLLFLNSMQQIFSPFAVPQHKTITKFNKL